MSRILSISLFVSAVASALICSASEPFPVVHHEPLTVRVLDGASGKPRAGVRVVLAGGYTERDIALGLWQEGARTNASGEVRIPDALANLPFLRVWVIKAKSCQAKGALGRLLVDRIRNEGWNADNTCGTPTAAATPGKLVLFVSSATGAVVPSEPAALEDNAAKPAVEPQDSAASASSKAPEPIDSGTAAAFAAYEGLLPPQF